MPVNNMVPNFSETETKAKKKVDWAAKHEFIPKKKEFLEY